jgi:hypothetical protein
LLYVFTSSIWQEFELWKSSLSDAEQKAVIGFFSVIRRHDVDLSTPSNTNGLGLKNPNDLFLVPFSVEYKSSLKKASELLLRASELSDTSR